MGDPASSSVKPSYRRRVREALGFKDNVGHAWRGLRAIVKEQRSFRIEIIVAVLVVILSFLLSTTRSEKAVLIATVGGVLVLEVMNSVVEKVMDLLHPEKSMSVKIIKDMSAGAVMLASIAAVVLGIIVFLPDILALFK